MKKGTGQAYIAAEANCSAHDSAQHIPSSFIGREYSVTDEKCCSPAVICNDLHGHFCCRRLSKLLFGEVFDFLHYRQYKIDVIIGRHILDY